MQKKIDKNKRYSLSDICKKGLFPWSSNIVTVRGWIQKDRMNKNKLKAVIVGQGRATKYYIKGENLINFIANIESGSYRL